MSQPQSLPTLALPGTHTAAEPKVYPIIPRISVAMSGSWRNVTPIMEWDILQTTRWIITSGYRLVTGGALGADFIATNEALRLIRYLGGPTRLQQLMVILPTPLDVYYAHYRQAARESKITFQQADELHEQLLHVKATAALAEMKGTACTEETYYARNTRVLEASQRLAAFQLNNSTGTQDMIDKATAWKMPVTVKCYKTRALPAVTEMAEDD